MVMFVRKTDKPEETLLVVSNFDNVAHSKFRVGVPFMCSAKSLISSDDKKYGGSGAVKRTAHKAVKADWDERNYAVDLEIPAMSTTIYQLTPCAEPAPKATEAKKTATKSSTTKKTTAKKAAAKNSTTKKAVSEEKAELVSPKKTSRKKTTVPKQMTEAKAAATQAVEAAKADPKKSAAKSTKASAQRKSVQKAALDQKLTKRRKG